MGAAARLKFAAKAGDLVLVPGSMVLVARSMQQQSTMHTISSFAIEPAQDPKAFGEWSPSLGLDPRLLRVSEMPDSIARG